ncbi:MAG: GTPase ObgE [Gammaproteobacteria bacterium]|jgi:GTP-binding protein|nr:GTPase ObgE [Gammaproteobacteria bacterium]HIB81834.1 GTPase ObgE [Gammaproteobacteria bacterium]HIO32962.1 GTPase ObgE [Gammaproteobacteria bacterium]HIP05169.1 GTPase ObgE [Gammaproteobacteria bacterium]
MKFVDEATIEVLAGKGGDGCLSFRREKFVPRGGPDGGDGGRGGDVVLVADGGINSLAQFRYKRKFSAVDGKGGAGRNRTGAGGEDCRIRVPAGTLVYDADTKERITDINRSDTTFVVAQGGRGGVGNIRFKSSTNRAPRRTVPGTPGDARTLRLELQVLADVGLLGLPNAGKSTFLRAVSQARPKVADYPFTTLHPQLGVVDIDVDSSFVIADIPGLIDGAAAGAGLGVRFLNHLRRTRLLLHMVDVGPEISNDPVADIKTVENELAAFDPDLASRPRWLVLNKVDLMSDEEADQILQTLVESLSWTSPSFVVSGLTGKGCRELVFGVQGWLTKQDQSTRQ